MANNESKRRKISTYAFTTLNSFSAVILLGFAYFLNTKGFVDNEVLTKLTVGSLGIVTGISIVAVLHYLKTKTIQDKGQRVAAKLANAKMQVASNMMLEHDREIDEIIEKLRAQKYER